MQARLNRGALRARWLGAVWLTASIAGARATAAPTAAVASGPVVSSAAPAPPAVVAAAPAPIAGATSPAPGAAPAGPAVASPPGAAGAGSAAGPGALAPAAAADPRLRALAGSIPWLTLLVIALALAVVAVAIWLAVRWWRRRALTPRPASQPALGHQLAEVWAPFYRDLPARARHLPTVIVLGDAGAGKSHLIDARVDWRGQANQFFPSAVESPLLQLYLGSDVVVHELSAPLLRDIGRTARRALTRLWRQLGPGATVIVVIDARALITTPPDTLRELAQLVRGKIRALPARCRAEVAIRVCLSHMDQIEGYDELVSVVGADHGAIEVAGLGQPFADASAVAAAAQAVMARYDGQLSYGLVNRTSAGFARLVGFYARFPVLLAQLAPLLGGLAGQDANQPRYAAPALYLTSLAPDNHVGDPFVVDRNLAAASIARQRRLHRRTSLAAAGLGVSLLSGLMWWHDGQVDRAEQAVTDYTGLIVPGRGPSESQARRVLGSIARMHSGERLWLDHSFVDRKQDLENQFADDLRRQYALPLIRSDHINRSTMLYIVAFIYASDDNGLRQLIRENRKLWVSKLELSDAVVSTYLEVCKQQYRIAESFDPKYTGSDWQGFVFDRLKPLYDQPQAISQGQLDDLLRDTPQLYDGREYIVRRRIIDLLTAQISLATQPSIKKLLDSPLGASEWVEGNIAALQGIRDALAISRLTPSSPRTLSELGTDLERILAVPATGHETYRVSRTRSSGTELFELDVAAWNRKLAMASAAQTIAALHRRSLDKPDQAIGFFPPRSSPRVPVVSATAQGPTIELPSEYTAAAFAQQVAPALDFITDRAGNLGLGADEMTALAALYRTQIDDYAEDYTAALRAYYASFRFESGGEDALPFALAGMVQPSSWFLRFLATVASNASPALRDGAYYATMADSLAEFRPLAELLAPAKGAIPGLAPYQQIITELATALAPAPSPAAGPAPAGDDAGSAATVALAGSLSRSGTLVLNRITGVDKDRVAQVSGWLAGANVRSNLHAPFLAPIEAAYALGLGNINRVVNRAWHTELSPLVDPLLARFPFRISARSDVAIADLEAVLRGQGKRLGTFWLSFARWLAPVTALRGTRYQWLGGVSGPAGSLATVNDLSRLSRALWDGDGNPSPLAIELTPQPLDASPASGRVATLAYLRSGSTAVYAFNQRPGPGTLALPWWDQGASSIILRMSRPGTGDSQSYSLDEPESPFSFFHLLCRARARNIRRGSTAAAVCDPGVGLRVWDIALDDAAVRSVTFTLDTDPWALFRIAR
jgi:type VI secretion system protein ImpL